MQKYRRLFKVIAFARPSKLLLIIVGFMAVFSSLTSLLFPLLTQQLIDGFTDAKSLPVDLLVLLIGLLTLGAILSGVNIYLIGKMGNRMLVNLRTKILSKAIYLPVSYYDKNMSTEPASRVVNDTGIINSLVSEHFESVISGVLTMSASLIVLWIIDWQLTAVLFATLFGSLIIVVPILSKLTSLSKKLQEKEAHFLGFITERLSQIRLIKAFTAERHSIESSREILDKLYQIQQKEVKIGAVIGPILGLTIVATLVIILVYGAMRVSEGAISMGTLIAFILYIMNIIGPMAQLAGFNAALNKAAGASERVYGLLDEEDECFENNQQVAFPNNDIVFRNIEFEYNPELTILKGFNLTIPANQMIAIVGESGAGKSTLFSLLLRYYKPTNGDILIGDQSIEDYSLYNLRRQIGYIAQDSPLLSGSIRDNLLLGVESKPQESRINEILKLALLDEFIDELPDGLDTQIGERGTKLSGGQKQRVAIARAMLRDSKILLCDEATSNLDAATEYKIQQAMNSLEKNRTTLIVAHRLSTVLDADKIIVMKNGQVIGEGTHQELLESQSYYKELVEHQLRAFNENIGS
jgi:ATP-binding cassette subfamily B protein AbcA/BmrA